MKIMKIFFKYMIPEKGDKSELQNPLEGKQVIFVKNSNDPLNADGIRGHLEEIGEYKYSDNIYDKYIKRGLDIVLSLGGLVIFSPLLLGIAIAIYLDDPGPVFFTQKRVGKNKKYFILHKFRSMKMSTPRNVPTHMLEQPEQYITHVGRFIREHSLDELPQLFDILSGAMSIIGPRPGLWNQDVLIAERDKYGANNIKPGLTGWAQINGRDELNIYEKAKLDGEYVKRECFRFDVKCFFGSFKVFAHDSSLIEGGKKTSDEELPSIAICHENLNYNIIKRVLVAGIQSYIGNAFEQYTLRDENITVDFFDTLSDDWKTKDFSDYDVICDVAGIAHIKEKKANRNLYYKINRDLAVEIARKAKSDGVKQFIYLSSMSVYGLTEGEINKYTVPKPKDAYGKSKLEAEKLLWELNDEDFIVSIIRPPMVYGNACKGNYQKLRKFILRRGVFLKCDNVRSMLFIDNLSSVIRAIIYNAEPGIYFPQNINYMPILNLAREIAYVNGRNIHIINMTKTLMQTIIKKNYLLKKVFGTLMYEKNTNVPSEWISIKENEMTIKQTEKIKICNIENEKISIIMPMFNSEKYIIDAIKSVINQKYIDWELIVINDGSRDKSREIVQKFMIKDSRIKLVDMKINQGIACARNIGIEKAEGRYLAFLDSDDIWNKSKLDKQIKIIKKGQSFVFSGCEIVEDNGKPANIYRKVPKYVSYKKLLKGNVIPTSSVLLDRNFILPFKMPRMNHEDYATWLKLLKDNDVKAYGINEPLVSYRKSENSISKNKIKALNWTWHVYRDSEKFGNVKSVYCLFRFILNTSKKYLIK